MLAHEDKTERSVSLSGTHPQAPPETGTIGNMGPSRGQRAGAPTKINPPNLFLFN